jgi:hypothetical protein
MRNTTVLNSMSKKNRSPRHNSNVHNNKNNEFELEEQLLAEYEKSTDEESIRIVMSAIQPTVAAGGNSNDETDPHDDDDPTINTRTPRLSIVLHDAEHAIVLAGGFGAYQIVFLIASQILTIVLCGNYSLMTYSTMVPTVECTTTTNGSR